MCSGQIGDILVFVAEQAQGPPTAEEAEGHRWNEQLGAHMPDEVVTLPVTAPDGGLVTTLTDFVRWTDV